MSYTPTLSNFGVPLLGAGAGGGKIGLLQPKPKYRFRVRVANFGTNLDQEDITRQVLSVTKPQIEHEIVEVHSYNSRAYYAGKHSWNTITLVLYDDITNAASSAVLAQQQKQLNHFEQTGWAAGMNYKFDMFIETLDGGNIKILDQWFIEGCFISGTEFGDFDYSASESSTISLTIRYDNAQNWGEDGFAETMPGLGGGAPRNPQGSNPFGPIAQSGVFL